MENTAGKVRPTNIIRKKKDIAASEGTVSINSSELGRKWFKAVEYFTCVDDINF